MDVRHYPSRKLTYIAWGITTLACLLAFVSIFWQHIASVAAATMAEGMAYGTIKSHVGVSAMALGWAGFALFALAAIGLFAVIWSKSLLDQLTND